MAKTVITVFRSLRGELRYAEDLWPSAQIPESPGDRETNVTLGADVFVGAHGTKASKAE
jgi:hypothetical protein